MSLISRMQLHFGFGFVLHWQSSLNWRLSLFDYKSWNQDSVLAPHTFYCLILLLHFLSFSCPFVVVVVLLLSRFVFPYTILEFICCISIFVVVVIVVWNLRNFVCLRKLASIWDVIYWGEIFWIFNGPSCQNLPKDSACSKWRWHKTSVMCSKVLAEDPHQQPNKF